MILFSIVGQFLIGWFIADFLSGVFHWWQDRVARTDLPWIGKAIIIPNRLHHIDPLVFTKSPFWRRNLPLWIVITIISSIWLLTLGPSIIWLSATFASLLVQEIHVLSHLPQRANFLVRILWKTALISSPEDHNPHHSGPSAQNYCMVTGFLNPVLDRLAFWHGLERLLISIRLSPNMGTA